MTIEIETPNGAINYDIQVLKSQNYTIDEIFDKKRPSSIPRMRPSSIPRMRPSLIPRMRPSSIPRMRPSLIPRMRPSLMTAAN